MGSIHEIGTRTLADRPLPVHLVARPARPEIFPGTGSARLRARLEGCLELSCRLSVSCRTPATCCRKGSCPLDIVRAVQATATWLVIACLAVHGLAVHGSTAAAAGLDPADRGPGDAQFRAALAALAAKCGELGLTDAAAKTGAWFVPPRPAPPLSVSAAGRRSRTARSGCDSARGLLAREVR